MDLIDVFFYTPGLQAGLCSGQVFDEQQQRIGDHGKSTRHSLLSTITAANLLFSALEKSAEMAKAVGLVYPQRQRNKGYKNYFRIHLHHGDEM